MTTRSGMENGLKTTRFLASILTIVACTAGLSSAQLLPPDPPDPETMCLHAGKPGIGPCFLNMGYRWAGECYYDDGCYWVLEICCRR